MSAWLDPLRHELDTSPTPVTFFFRDDDIGWADDRFLEVLDMFALHSLPVDLAVIPTAISTDLARILRARTEATPALVAVHQHGFSHANHETEGRRYEFGPSRSATAQRQDIERGRGRLADLLGPAVQSIFTPPWNRCTAVTADCLRELGFAVLSRDASARPLEIAGLFELPVGMDWSAHRQGVRLNRRELVQLLIRHMRALGPVGVMFHHALMDAAECAVAAELLGLVAGHPRARCRLMMAIVDDVTTAADHAARGRRPRSITKESES